MHKSNLIQEMGSTQLTWIQLCKPMARLHSWLMEVIAPLPLSPAVLPWQHIVSVGCFETERKMEENTLRDIEAGV